MNVSFINTNVADALDYMEQQGDFFFAYDPQEIDGTRMISLSAQNMKTGDILKEIFYNCADFFPVGNHIIIRRISPKNSVSFKISGFITDNADFPLDSAIVFDPEHQKLIISREDGSFSLDMNAERKRVCLFVSRPSYRDTVIYVSTDSRNINIKLYKKGIPRLVSREKDESGISKAKEKRFENLPLVQKLVPSEAIYISHINAEKIVPVQVSFLPKVGTNAFLKGFRVNYVSLNILSGYSKGLNGVEIGGIANIIQKNARGMQSAGIANIVSGMSRGVQLSGIVTYDFDDMHGFQASGIHNNIQGDFSGVQIGGISNVIYEDVYGTQLSGIVNMNMGDVSGAQISGIANLSKKTVKGMQFSGIYNQSAGLNGLQLSGTMNLNIDKARGVQVSPFLNKTKKLDGVQFGIVNIADTIESGAQIGLVNIVKHGTYSLELLCNETFFTGVNFVMGKPKFYSVMSFSSGDGILGLGYGLGKDFPLYSRFSLGTRIINTSVNKFSGLVSIGNKTSLDLSLNYILFEKLSLKGGFSANYFIPVDDAVDFSGETHFYGNRHISQSLHDNKNSFWYGWFCGIRMEI